MLPIVLLVVIQSLVLLVIPSVHNRRIQQFSLYSVTEQIENFTQNVADLDLVSSSVRENQLQSVCSQMGVWAFFTGKNYTTINSYGYHPATPGWTCSKRRIMADYQSPFRSIRHLGNVDLDTPSLSIYKDPFFASEELYMNGHELSLGGPALDFASFGFTGRDSWTIYSETNFTGESVCLLCKCDTTGLAVGVTYTAKVTLSAASIRRGCFGTQVLRPTGILDKRVPSAAETNSQNRNFVSLSLSNEKDVNASLLFSGTEVRLPCKKTFTSFQISRKSNWTVFGGSEFDGPSACLVYSPPSKTGDGSDMMTFPAMSIASIRFGCPQNLEKKNANVANPVPIFVANEKGTATPKPTTAGGRVTPAPPTPSSREGRGREIGPVNIPGDIHGLIPKETTGKSPTVTTGPTKRPPVTPSLVVEPIVSTGSAVIDNQLGQPSARPDSTGPPSARPDSTKPPSTRPDPTKSASAGPDPTKRTYPPPKPAGQGRTEIPPRLEDRTKTTTTTPGPVTDRVTTTTTEMEQEVTEPPATREQHGKVLEAGPGPSRSEAATVQDSGAAGMFFTAFLIILGILVTAMIVTIAVFIYLRATRSAQVDME